MLAVGTALRGAAISVLTAVPGLISLALWIVVSMLFFDTWSDWTHRLVHTRRRHPVVHRWLRRIAKPTVWSNNGDLLPDSLILQPDWFFAPIVLPALTLVRVGHRIRARITGMTGHADCEYAQRLHCQPARRNDIP